MRSPESNQALSEFLSQYRAAIVILSGEARGLEYRLDQPRTALGRGPGVDLALDDEALRCQHALIEFDSDHFALREPDDEERGTRELKDGDRFSLGAHEFAFVLEPRA